MEAGAGCSFDLLAGARGKQTIEMSVGQATETATRSSDHSALFRATRCHVVPAAETVSSREWDCSDDSQHAAV